MTSFIVPTSNASVKPWYRERWPWFLVAGPALVVVAGLVTAYIAWSTDDGVIADDYYKRGLLINRSLERGARSEALRIGAIVHIAGDGTARVELTGLTDVAAPAVLTLRLIHATRAGYDRVVVLARDRDGAYRGHIEPPPPGRWMVSVETDVWRLPMAEIAGRPDEVRLGVARETP
jgi:hypothetical protein